jgi:hypothetical protein
LPLLSTQAALIWRGDGARAGDTARDQRAFDLDGDNGVVGGEEHEVHAMAPRTGEVPEDGPTQIVEEDLGDRLRDAAGHAGDGAALGGREVPGPESDPRMNSRSRSSSTRTPRPMGLRVQAELANRSTSSESSSWAPTSNHDGRSVPSS